MSAILRTALSRQKRLLMLLVLTMLLPSAILAFFAVRAVRNESFRLAKQVENEYRLAAESLESEINSALAQVEQALQSLAGQERVMQKRYAEMERAWADLITAYPLIEQVFVAFSGENPFSPLLESGPGTLTKPPAPLSTALDGLLKQAQRHEFEESDCNRAIALYDRIAGLARDRNTRAQMLASVGRCLMKLGRFDRALSRYQEVSSGLSDCVGTGRIPMGLAARVQMARCRKMMGDTSGAVSACLQLYRYLLRKPGSLSQDQYAAYSSIVEEMLSEMPSPAPGSSGGARMAEELAGLKSRHRERRAAFELANTLRDDAIPALVEMANSRSPNRLTPIRYAHPHPQRSFLLIAAMIPGSSGRTPTGMIGAVIDNRLLEEGHLAESISRLRCTVPPRVVVSTLSGEVIRGVKSQDAATVTSVFKRGFPPWKIELFDARPQLPALLQMSRSFYFWMVPVLVLILMIGATLTARTIVHQVQILATQSDLVSLVTHEFKTPLASMSALLERLRDGKVKEDQKVKQYFSIMSADLEKLNRMVNNILNAARVEEGRVPYSRVGTDLRPRLQSTMEMFQNSRRDSGIGLEVQIAEDLPPLFIDPDAISMALSNLLDNAVKFSKEDTQIRFRAERKSEGVILEVEDSGIGIPPDELGKIFGKFYRGRDALKRSVGGLGLGLATARRIIEDHGGKLTVESKVGIGTRFRIFLPGERGGSRHAQEAAHH